MNANNEIEKNLKKLNWPIPPEIDQKILTDVEEFLKNPSPSTPIKICLFLFKQWQKATTAAALIAIAAVLYVVLDKTPTLTLAQVQQAVNEQTWVHVKYDNGREEWNNLRGGQYFLKEVNGFTMFADYPRGLRYNYNAEHGNYITEMEIPAYSTSPMRYRLDMLLHSLDMAGSKDMGQDLRHEVINGRSVVRFEMYTLDAFGKRHVCEHLWVDTNTRLPFRSRRYLSLADRKSQKREFVTGDYEFPATGPSSIFDLGVPRNTEIVTLRKNIDNPTVKGIVEAGKKAHYQFPRNIRVVERVVSRPAEIDINYQNGIKYHWTRYFNMRDKPEYFISLSATTDQILEWSKRQIPITLTVSDGKRYYSRNNSHPEIINAKETTVRVMRLEPFMYSNCNWPQENQWTYAVMGGGLAFEPLISPDLPPGCVGLTQTAGDGRREYYIDPSRDYIEVKKIWWKKRNGNWEKDREDTFSEFTQLPTGQWYATKRNLINYPDPARGTSRGDTTWKIDIKILDDSEYPPDIFNGEKLLEGAKLETY
ncbi:MAG: hypothetical protein WC975_09670 [Phycisphaerae bacterium]